MRFFKTAASLLFLILLWGAGSARAESVTAARDGTGTTVTAVDGQYDIGGGTLVEANLFHSFEQLGLTQGEIANFLANPDIENILGRVVGGDPSVINGLIQVTGSDANLFLLNPAGILFGPNAQLNIGGDFTATAATGIQLDEGWFSSVGDNDLSMLGGTPSGFVFATEQAGAVVNAGNLSAQRIVLLGGTVINTGTLSAPGGDITIEAVPGESIVAITQAGSLLSLGVPVSDQAGIGRGTMPLTPLTLPQLLSNRPGLGQRLGVVVDGDQVRLTRSNTVIPTEAGVAIASGTLEASNATAGESGGRIDILGEQVALVDAEINASGEAGAGNIRIGGGFQGNDSVQNAQSTYVGADVAIAADAITTGDGGQVIVWADGTTRYYGDISAQGGNSAGDGGFIEISGRETLIYRGEIDVSSPAGEFGTLLLDPQNITIVDKGSVNPDIDDTAIGDSIIRSDERPDDTFTISETALETAGGGNADIILEATNNITIENLADDELQFTAGTGSITFTADSDDDGQGSFLMGNSEAQSRIRQLCPNLCNDSENSANGLIDNIEANGRDLTIRGAGIVAGRISNNAGGELRNISLEATNGDIYVRDISLSGDPLSDTELKDPPRGNITITARNGIFRATGGTEAISILSVANDVGIDDRARSGNITISAQSSREFGIGAQLIFDPPSQIVDVIRAAVIDAGLDREDAYTNVEPEVNPNPGEPETAPIGIDALLREIETDDSLNSLVGGTSLVERPSQTGGIVLPNIFSEINQSIEGGLNLGNLDLLRQQVLSLAELSDDLTSDPPRVVGGDGSLNLALIEDFILTEGQSGLRGAILRRNSNGQSDSGGTNGSSLGDGIAFNEILDAPPNSPEVREESEKNLCEEEEGAEEDCQEGSNSEPLLNVEAVMISVPE